MVAGILCIITAASLGLITAAHVVQVSLTQNTSIVTMDKIGLQFVWLANLSTRWYTSFDVRLFTNSTYTSLLPMPVYAVPVNKLIPNKGMATTLMCTCHANLTQCYKPNYNNVTLIKEFLFAGFNFTYNICVSSTVSNAITMQAFIFEITDDSDYDDFKNYLSTGNASSALFKSECVNVKGPTINAQHTCVELSVIIPRNTFYFAVTKVVSAPETLPILHMKECNAVVQFRDFSRTEYSQSCTVSDDQPCTSAPVPSFKNFIANTLDPEVLAILVNASQSYSVPTVLQVTATVATNSNVFLFAVVMILIAVILSVSVYIFVCIFMIAKCSKGTSQ